MAAFLEQVGIEIRQPVLVFLQKGYGQGQAAAGSQPRLALPGLGQLLQGLEMLHLIQVGQALHHFPVQFPVPGKHLP